MNNYWLFAIMIVSFFLFTLPSESQAEVWIPEDEFISYIDTNGVYTVVGTIKNSEEFAVIPTVTVNIQDGEQLISKSFKHTTIQPFNELPFKIKLPVENPLALLLKPSVSFVPTTKIPLNVEVIYDETLVKHEDGHLTGRIINKGESTVYNIKVSAVIHGFDKVLDVGQNIELIEKMDPGEVQNFSMHPDPSIESEINYYSCFAVGNDSIVTLNAKRNDEQFIIRIDSGLTISYPEFGNDGKNLSLTVLGGWPLADYANLEFPLSSEKEKFNVFLNDEPIDFFQSIDEMKNWHVAFNLPPQTQGELLITGFEKDVSIQEKSIEIPSNIEITVFNPPLKQLQIGIEPENVVCKEEHVIILKNDGFPACVKIETAEKLEERGWGFMRPGNSTEIMGFAAKKAPNTLFLSVDVADKIPQDYSSLPIAESSVGFGYAWLVPDLPHNDFIGVSTSIHQKNIGFGTDDWHMEYVNLEQGGQYDYCFLAELLLGEFSVTDNRASVILPESTIDFSENDIDRVVSLEVFEDNTCHSGLGVKFSDIEMVEN